MTVSAQMTKVDWAMPAFSPSAVVVWGSGTVLRDRVHRSRFPVLPPGIPNYSNSGTFLLTFSNQSAAADKRSDLDAEWAVKMALRKVDLFISVGTSGTVYPANGYMRSARYTGAETVYINLEPLTGSGGKDSFDRTILGKAEEVLPRIVGSHSVWGPVPSSLQKILIVAALILLITFTARPNMQPKGRLSHGDQVSDAPSGH